jgi:Glycosyltransferase family 87
LTSGAAQTVEPTWPKFRRRFAQLFVLGMLWINLLFFLDLREGIRRGYPDFTIFYTAGTMLRQGLGHQLYDRASQYRVQESFTGHIAFRLGPLPYNHPPFEAVIFLPLSLLSYPHAFVAWNLINLAALFGVAAVLRRSVKSLSSFPKWKFVFGCLAFFPVFACFLEGQDSAVMLLFCTLAFRALKNKSDPAAGGWLALASFKFQFMLPIVLLLFLWKRRRVSVGFGSVAAALGLISVAWVGWRQVLHYPGFVLQIANQSGLSGLAPQYLPNLHGLAMGWHALSGALGAAFAFLLSIAVFSFAMWKGRASVASENFELQFSLAILVSVLIAWQTNSHDLSLLVLPLVLIADYTLRVRPRSSQRKLALLIPVLPLLISPLWIALWLVIAKVNLIAIPLLWWMLEIGRELSGGTRDTIIEAQVERPNTA